MQVFHHLFFGPYLAPSTLLALERVPTLESENAQYQSEFNLDVIAVGQSSLEAIEAYFRTHPGRSATFKPTEKGYILQASQQVYGRGLDSFLEQGGSLETLDLPSFSALVLGSLVTAQGDYKPNNIIVAWCPVGKRA